jgi:hypothetical protein
MAITLKNYLFAQMATYLDEHLINSDFDNKEHITTSFDNFNIVLR